jgi:peptidyl-prolyl cis-trans isomerase C
MVVLSSTALALGQYRAKLSRKTYPETDAFGRRFFYGEEEAYRNMKNLIFFIFGVTLVFPAMAQSVIHDDGVGFDRAEMERVVASWTPQMQQAAANDLGDRLELLNLSLANKKIARAAEQLTPEEDPDLYWKYIFEIRNTQRRFMGKIFLEKLEIPDMSALAKERYETERDKYARVPERRMSSHILFQCLPGKCKRAEKRPVAQKVLDELRQGADFSAMVKQYSEDPGSKNSGGRFDQWLQFGEPDVTPNYVGAVYQIDEVGQYADLAETEFGFHIVRLDGIEPEHYQPYERVKPQIVAALKTDYKRLAVKEFDAQFQLTDEAYIDGKAMEEIFEPYKTSP